MEIKFNENFNFLTNEDNFKKNSKIKSTIIFDNCLNEKPFITIAIPAYKRPTTLKQTLESAINQKGFKNYEIIVVDNEAEFGIETDTEKLIKSYKIANIRYFKNNQNIGMFGNWNRCFELARGEYVALLHDDDIIKEEFLAETTAILKRKKTALLSISHKIIDEKKNKIIGQLIPSFKKIRHLTSKDFYYFHPISNVATIYNKSIMLAEGGFNQDSYPVTDFLTNYKISNKYGSLRLLKILGYYRQGFNESSNLETKYNSLFALYYFRKKIQIEKKYFLGNFLNKILFAASILNFEREEIRKKREAIIKSKFKLKINAIIGKIIIRIKLLLSYKYHVNHIN